MFNSNFHIWGSVDVGHLSPRWGSKGVLVWWCSHHWKVFYDIEHCSHHWEFWPCFQKWAKAIFYLCHRHVITAAHCTKDKNKKRLDISWKSWFSQWHVSSSPASCQASSQWGLESGTWATTTTTRSSCLSPPSLLILTLGFHSSFHFYQYHRCQLSHLIFVLHFYHLIIHFRPNGFYNDVAIFTLKQPVQFSQWVVSLNV